MTGTARRILFLSHGAELGGAELVLLELLARLDRSRIHPCLATLVEGPLTVRARGLGVETTALGAALRFTRRSGVLKAAREAPVFRRVVVSLSTLIRAQGATLVYTNSAKSHVYGALAGRLTGRRVVARVHDIVAAPAFGPTARRALALALGRLADRVLPVSRAAAAALAKLGVPSGNVRVVYNGVAAELTASEAERAALRQALGLPAGAIVVAAVGRLSPWKGQHLLLEALPELVRRHPDVRAIVVGGSLYASSAYAEELRALARARGLDGVVRFLGFREDARELLRACDVLVHTAVEPDPLPTVLLEALAKGVFVVAADAGGVPEIVDDDRLGLRYPPGDVAALVANLDAAVAERRYAQRDAVAAERALAKFSLAGYVRAIEEELTEERASAKAARTSG